MEQSIPEDVTERVQSYAGLPADQTRFQKKVAHAVSQRMDQLNYDSMDEYRDHLENNHPDETQQLAEQCLVNETLFYRYPDQMKYLQRTGFKRLSQSSDPIRIASIGCSTGAEPYSLVMAHHEAQRKQMLSDCSITAWDLSTQALQTARSGEYISRTVEHAPQRIVRRYFTPVGDHRYQVDLSIRNAVDFYARNILEDPLPGEFDLILCRNLLIYFDDERRKQVVDKLIQSLDSSGLLMASPTEFIYSNQLQAVQNNQSIYEQSSSSREPSTSSLTDSTSSSMSSSSESSGSSSANSNEPSDEPNSTTVTVNPDGQTIDPDDLKTKLKRAHNSMDGSNTMILQLTVDRISRESANVLKRFQSALEHDGETLEIHCSKKQTHDALERWGCSV